MLFKEIIGQEEVKNHLVQSVRNNRIAHAQMFLGREGSGNLALALAYAQFINCENRQPDDSCGTCGSCNKYSRLIHPDLHFTFPTIGPKELSKNFLKEWREAVLENPYMNVFDWLQFIKAENKQGNITAEECRDVITRLSMKSYEGDYKVLILWMPEFLKETGNSLLKIIEEPPYKTLFLLVANEYDKILPTILSRTQLVKIPGLKEEDVADSLVERMRIDRVQALSLSFLCNGNYNQAMKLCSEEGSSFFEPFRQWVNFCYMNKMLEVMQWIDDFASVGREVLKHFFGYGMHLIRECLMNTYVGDKHHIKLVDAEKEFARRLSGSINADNGYEIYNEFNQAVYHIERNANPRIVLINVSLQLRKYLRAGMKK